MPPKDLAEGVVLFNEEKFWHAHEAWERIWLVATGDEKRFLQGLIQLAAAYHHVQKGTLRGAGRLFDAALDKLSALPPGAFGLDRSEAVTRGFEDREKLSRGEHIKGQDFPKLRYN